MPEVSLIWVMVSLVGGGAAGAIITALVTAHRTRVQPVSYLLSVTSLGEKLGKIQFTAELDGKPYGFDNVHSVDLVVANSGNQDLPEFKFGIDLPNGFHVIGTEVEAPDRYHHGIVTPEPSIEHLRSGAPPSIDVVLKPFNRLDQYRIRLNATHTQFAAKQSLDEVDVKLSTGTSITFKDQRAIARLAAEVPAHLFLGEFVAGQLAKTIGKRLK